MKINDLSQNRSIFLHAENRQQKLRYRLFSKSVRRFAFFCVIIICVVTILEKVFMNRKNI